MKRLSRSRANKRFSRDVISLLKHFGASRIQVMSCYYSNEMIHFVLPNNYKIGIWQWSKSIFAQHLGCIDKFKPSYSEFSTKYTCLEDIVAFVESITKESHVDGEEYLEAERCDERAKMERFRHQYHTILNMNGVRSIELKGSRWSKILCITMQSEEFAEEPIETAIDDMVEYEDYLYGIKIEFYDI